jgi:predicted XRE-type DNA-binding protein
MATKTSKKEKRPKIVNAAKLKRDGIPRDRLWVAVFDRIVQFGLSRDLAAVIVRDAASQMSRLMTGNVSEFSADRLALMLVRLACDIDIVVRPLQGPSGLPVDKLLKLVRDGKLRGRVRVLRELRNGQRHEITV